MWHAGLKYFECVFGRQSFQDRLREVRINVEGAFAHIFSKCYNIRLRGNWSQAMTATSSGLVPGLGDRFEGSELRYHWLIFHGHVWNSFARSKTTKNLQIS